MSNNSNTRPTASSKQQLAGALSRNSHSLVVMTPEEFLDFAITQQKSSGMTTDQVATWLDTLTQSSTHAFAESKKHWNLHESTVKMVGAYLPVASDAKKLRILALEMHKGGTIFGQYRVNTYKGRSYVILKGNAGLRSQLTGSRYLANNPKVVSMGIGKLGVANAIKGGVIISVIFSVAFHALEQLMNDEATWHHFVGDVSVDVASATAGAAIAWLVVSGMVGATAMAAIGPIALVVFAGGGATVALNALGDHFELANNLAELLKKAEQRMLANLQETQHEIRKGLNYAHEDPVGFLLKLFNVPYLEGFE
ncbi:MAG: hypothetical protein JKY01_10635 [Pseudomonadales bacterium]|nr:hypothetical protein [Pseudomonadales bacterium]